MNRKLTVFFTCKYTRLYRLTLVVALFSNGLLVWTGSGCANNYLADFGYLFFANVKLSDGSYVSRSCGVVPATRSHLFRK